MNTKLRVGVIGLGQMGVVHAHALSHLPNVDVVAIADVDRERLRLMTDELGARPFTDYRELVQLPELDAVDICMPDEMHMDPVLEAAAARKHVFLEKPLATDVSQAESMISACRAAGVRLMVGHLLRFDPRYEVVARAIGRGDLGEVTHVMAHRNSPWTEGPMRYPAGTSLTYHVAVHDLDLVNWFLGARPRNVFARAVRRKLADKNMDDSVSALIEFDSGALGNFQYSWALPPTSVAKLDARLEVIGTEGMAIVGTYHGQAVFLAGKTQAAPDVHHGPRLYGLPAGDVREELRAFVAAVLDGVEPPYAVADALLAVREADAIERSLRSGEAVTLGEAVAG